MNFEGKVNKTCVNNDDDDDIDDFFLNNSQILKMQEKLNNLECKICSINNSIYWREVGLNIFVCNLCFMNKLFLKLYKNRKLEQQTERSVEEEEEEEEASAIKTTITKTKNNKKRSSRLNIKRLNHQQNKVHEENNLSSSQNDDNSSTNSTSTLNSKNRRNSIFKKTRPKKVEISSCSVNTAEFVFHRGFYLQIDDIVSLFDGHDLYYAQIRGFLTDQYAFKSAIITWLLPTNLSRLDNFDENTFVLGPDEELPRSLDCMKFVCRPKQIYLKHKHLLYDTNASSTSFSYSNCYLKDVKKNCLNLYSYYNSKFYSRESM